MTHFEDFCAVIPYTPDNIMKSARKLKINFPVTSYEAAEIEYFLACAPKTNEWSYWTSIRENKRNLVLDKVRSLHEIDSLEENLELLSAKIERIFSKEDRYPLSIAMERDRIKQIIDNSYNFMYKE